MLLLLLLAASFSFATSQPEQTAAPAMTTTQVKNPGVFVYGSIGDADSLDPAYAYDNASGMNIRQLYETLVYYDRGTANLVPVLATQVPTAANGGISADGKTYTFTIRDGVKFHNGKPLTAEDVEYSIERVMAIDNTNGGVWMYWMVFFDASDNELKDDGTFAIPFEKIDAAVEAQGNKVIFKLANPFAPFLGIMAGYWASIVDKETQIAAGDWDGTAADMKRVFGTAKEEMKLYETANGTGPFKLDRWVHDEEVVVSRFDGYWGPKPALTGGIMKVVPEWSTRKLMLLQGDLDYADVLSVNYPEMDTEPGFTVYKDLPSLSVSGIQFNQKVNAQDNPALGSGKLDGKGIPADFFSDLNVRLGFMYAWDEATFIRDLGAGTIKDPVTPFPFGLPYKNEQLERPAFDLTKAADYLKKAWGGQLWANGMTLDLVYNDGNDVRGGGLRIIAENINSLNPKFKITVSALPWPQYLDASNNRRMPLFFIGWAPDYPDVDNYAGPFMESTNYFATRGSYNNPEADRLIKDARYATDPKVRQADYYKLQQIYLDDAVGIVNNQTLTRRYVPDYVTIQGGHFYNPVDADFYIMLKYFNK